MASLVFESVKKVFGKGSSEYLALDDINFEAESGQLILVVGPSGSGKTTFLTIAGGLQTPTAGKVKINGVNIESLSKKEQAKLRLQRIGFILQSYNLVPFLTVEDQFNFVDKIKRNNFTLERHKKILTDLGLLDLLKKYPNELSGGQKQRVAIARALYTDPDYILADEPTAALDTERAVKVIDLLKNLAHEESKIIIVVTHDLRLKDKADKVYQIIDGKMNQVND